MSFRVRPAAVVAVLVLCAAACGGSSGDPVTPGAGESRSPSPSPSPAKTIAPVVGTPKGWRSFSYQRIAFAYPPIRGTVLEASDGETGPRHAWTIKRSDLCDPRGNCRSYEFAAVNDGCPGTEEWPTFAHRWVQSGEHFVTTCAGKDSFRINPLRIVTRTDGLKGVIYDANAWFGSKTDVKIPGALAAVLNFPKGFHKNYEAIAFYFEDPTPLATIETVLKLVKLAS